MGSQWQRRHVQLETAFEAGVSELGRLEQLWIRYCSNGRGISWIAMAGGCPTRPWSHSCGEWREGDS